VAAARLLTEGKVIAIEPVSKWVRRLQDNVYLNDFKNITVLQIALGAKAETRPVYNTPQPFYDGTQHDGLTSLFPSAQRTVVVEHVHVERWDDVMSRMGIPKVDVMKLDIEGGEWYALQGAQQTLERLRPILVFELETEHCRNAGYEAEDFLMWLVHLGYRLERIHKDRTVPFRPQDILPSQNVVAYPE
jgi:FkbM family methyltransferase